MLDEKNFVPVERTSPQNQGKPILAALKELKADQGRAKAIGKAGQHLVMEVLHGDNIDRLVATALLPGGWLQFSSFASLTSSSEPASMHAHTGRPSQGIYSRGRHRPLVRQ
jgi:hypothetical protein